MFGLGVIGRLFVKMFIDILCIFIRVGCLSFGGDSFRFW